MSYSVVKVSGNMALMHEEIKNPLELTTAYLRSAMAKKAIHLQLKKHGESLRKEDAWLPYTKYQAQNLLSM